MNCLQEKLALKKSSINSEKSQMIVVDLKFIHLFVVVNSHPSEVFLTHYLCSHHSSDDLVIYDLELVELFIFLRF